MADRKVKAQLFKPEARVRFYTAEGIITARSRSVSNKEGEAIDYDVISITTNVDLATDAGTFQITLSSKNRWDKVIASNDMIDIAMRRRGEDLNTDAIVFVGLVDDIRKTVEVQESNIHRVITITGRNFAKAFINFEIGAIAGYAPDTYFDSRGWFGSELVFDGEKSSTNIKSFLDNKLFKKMSYTFSDGRKLTDVLEYDKLSSRDGEKCIFDTNFNTFSGTAWDFMKEVSDEPFNELYLECIDGKPNLIERPTPFNPEDWENLSIITVDDINVMSNDVGRSDTETYTFFIVNTTDSNIPDDMQELIKPVYYEPYLDKFGVKTLRRYTKYATVDNIDSIKEYRNLLYNWNCMNARFWNGEITVIGDSCYKLGYRLLYESEEDGRDIEYYIESVTHQFVNFGSWTTKLSVTRGIENAGRDRFESPWGAFQEYDYSKCAWATIDGDWRNPESSSSGGSSGGETISGGVKGSVLAMKVVAYAKSFLSKNTSYVFGGGRNMNAINTGTFDCSSFVWHMFNACGVSGIGDLSGATTDTLAKRGKAVAKSDIRIGDIVYWHTYKHNGHVGIYVGDRQAIACNTGKGVSIVDMDGSYWKSKESDTIRRLC